jgi:hypothetical protein
MEKREERIDGKQTGNTMYKRRDKETVLKGYWFEFVSAEISRINHKRGKEEETAISSIAPASWLAEHQG